MSGKCFFEASENWSIEWLERVTKQFVKSLVILDFMLRGLLSLILFGVVDASHVLVE